MDYKKMASAIRSERRAMRDMRIAMGKPTTEDVRWRFSEMMWADALHLIFGYVKANPQFLKSIN